MDRFLGRIRCQFPEEDFVRDSRQSLGGFIIIIIINTKNILYWAIAN